MLDCQAQQPVYLMEELIDVCHIDYNWVEQEKIV